jgi:16S rRNA (cytidine1402-2'-O)-methyltransferase
MIVLAATPIGNLADASPRLCQSLESADVIAAEDTRRTRQLLRLLKVDTAAEIVALHDHNEQANADRIVELAREKTVVVVSDAGMPTVSDPGYRVVARAAEAGVTVTAVPGPSAVVTALAVSGLATDRFCFEGFVPRKSGERRRLLEELDEEKRTMVFFESPQRIAATLTDCATAFGEDRQAAVCRELTKLHEEVQRGSLAELIRWAEATVKGEIVLVIAGRADSVWTFARAQRAVAELVADGMRRKDATREVAKLSGVSARELYNESISQ